MKLLILALCATAAFARPDVSHLVKQSTNDRDATITKQDLDVGVEGQYQWAIETSNGIAAHEHGELKNIDKDTSASLVGGAASWVSPEGEQVDLKYTADENGYQPTGSHIPTPPPIPEAIIRSLEYIKAHPSPPERR